MADKSWLTGLLRKLSRPVSTVVHRVAMPFRLPPALAILVGCLFCTPMLAQKFEINDRTKKVYAFEHQAIPLLVHEKSGMFLTDLTELNGASLRSLAQEMVDLAFADALKIERIDDARFLLTFEPPTQLPNCYLAVVEKTGTGLRYFTLELTLDIQKTGLKCVIGEWPEKRTHTPLGYVKYTDAKSFIESLDRRRELAAAK
jgi:hypothetical protein